MPIVELTKINRKQVVGYYLFSTDYHGEWRTCPICDQKGSSCLLHVFVMGTGAIQAQGNGGEAGRLEHFPNRDSSGTAWASGSQPQRLSVLLGCLGGPRELLDCFQLPDIGNFLLEQHRTDLDLSPIQASQGCNFDFVSSSRKRLLS